jgi:hypothetical protein
MPIPATEQAETQVGTPVPQGSETYSPQPAEPQPTTDDPPTPTTDMGGDQ